jgi:phosphoribulokinase
LTIVLLKESINSDGQQFHQYQQNELDMSARYRRDGQQFHQYQQNEFDMSARYRRTTSDYPFSIFKPLLS